MEQAFSTVLLVVLGNGKVSVELDTKRTDHPCDLQLTAMAHQLVLQVRYLSNTIDFLTHLLVVVVLMMATWCP